MRFQHFHGQKEARLWQTVWEQFGLIGNSRWLGLGLFLSFLMSSALSVHYNSYELCINHFTLWLTAAPSSKQAVHRAKITFLPLTFRPPPLLSHGGFFYQMSTKKITVNNLKHWNIFHTRRLQGEEELMAHIYRVTQQEGKLCRPPNVTQLRFQNSLWKFCDEQEQKHAAAVLLRL